MNESSKRENKEFLLKFYGSNSMQLFENAFSANIGKREHFLFLDSGCRPVRGKKKLNQCAKNLAKKIRQGPPREIQVFYGASNNICVVIPVRQGDNIYGYILAPASGNKPAKETLLLMKSFMDIALKEFQKEQELTRLYDTIRPRAIALSTIHTIHRLLSSTLDMDELIERMARLTLQVMRAGHCSIMLMDDSRNYLVPKAVIDLKNNLGKAHKKHRRIKLGVGTEGKVARTGKTVLSRNSICVPLVEEDIIGVICAKDKANNATFTKFDQEILLTLAEQAVIAIKNAQLYEEQKKMAYGSIRSLATLLDIKSPSMYTHSDKFVKIVIAIAEEMRVRGEDLRNLRYAALLPDTGRFTIPDEILKKEGGLSKKEYAIIKKQHLESLKILEPLEFLKPAMPIITHHHERYDGTGYPSGLKGKNIPVGARIMAVADAFEAMVTLRPYKDRGITIPQAIKEIEGNRGTQFDPGVVDAFMAVTNKPEFKNYFTAGLR